MNALLDQLLVAAAIAGAASFFAVRFWLRRKSSRACGGGGGGCGCGVVKSQLSKREH